MTVTITGTNFSSANGFSIGDIGTEPTAAFTRSSDGKAMHLFKRTLENRQFPLRGSSWNTNNSSYYGTTNYSYNSAEYRDLNFPVHYFEERIVQVGTDPASILIYPFQLSNYEVGVEHFWYEALATYYVGNTLTHTLAFPMVGQFEKEGSTYTARNVQKSLTAYDYISGTSLDLLNVLINTSPPSIQLTQTDGASGTDKTIWNVYGFSVLTIA